MKQQLHIRASCVIEKHSIFKDQQLVFHEPGAVDAPGFLTSAYRHFNINYPRFYKMDNLCKLGWLCNEILVTEAGNDKQAGNGRPLQDVSPESVCVVLCNTSSSLDTDLKYYETVAQMASPALFVYTLPNIVIGEICIRNGWKGENMFFILESFDAAFLQQQVESVLKEVENKACICGWVELLDNNFKAALFLVEKSIDGQNLNFTPENILNIFEA